MLFKVTLFLLLFLPGALRAQTAALEVFDDSTFTQRSGSMAAGLKTLYVRIVPLALNPGYTAIEFRLTGLEGLLLSTMNWSNDPIVVLGSLADGMNVGWPTCQHDELLLAFTVFSLEPPENREIRVAAHTNPSNPNFDFPFLNNCDAPCIWCGYALEGEAYILNPIVAVEPSSWGHIKSLYQQ